MRLFSRFFILAIAIFGFATLPVLAESIKPAPISDEAYWRLVRSSREMILHLNGLTAEKTKQGREDLAKEWEAVTDVEINGKVTPIDNGYLTTMLRADEPNLEQIDEILSELQIAYKNQPTQIFSGAELASLHAILARPEFIWADQIPNPLNDLLQKLLDALSRLWNRIFGDEPITISINQLFLTVIATIILVVVFLFVFRTLFTDFIKEAQLNNDENGDNEILTSEAAFQKAQVLSQGGDYRSAVRYLYLSSLLLMDERGVMRYDRSKTNREYLRSVSKTPELSEPLSEVIEVFDNVWYGYHSLGEETFKHYSDRVEELKEKKS